MSDPLLQGDAKRPLGFGPPEGAEPRASTPASLDVLAFGPHPDDVEIFCGGTVIRLVELGYSVGVVDLTRGERATNGTPEERAREAAQAAETMGLRLRENLHLPDTGLNPHDPAQLAAAVGVLRRLRPELVLLPWIEERHPDHEAAAALLQKAAFFAGVGGFPSEPELPRFSPRQLLFYQLRHRMEPSFIVDTTSVAARKRQAIECYRSQLRASSGASTLIGSSDALESIEARDRLVGSMIGVRYGEALRSPAALGLVDPLRHFRENPFSTPHFFEPLR